MSRQSREPRTVIAPKGVAPRGLLADLGRGRGLLLFLLHRELAGRYGSLRTKVAPMVLLPALTVAVLTVIFGALLRVPSDGLPFALFVSAGLLPWALFSDAVGQASRSLTWRPALVRSAWMPLPVFPAASVILATADSVFLSAVIMAAGALLDLCGWRVLLFYPAVIPPTFLCALGVGLFSAAFMGRSWWVQQLVAFTLQLGFFLTPIVYPSSIIPGELRAYLYLNPLAGIIDLYRWLLGGQHQPQLSHLLLSAAAGLALVVLGGVAFSRPGAGASRGS